MTIDLLRDLGYSEDDAREARSRAAEQEAAQAVMDAIASMPDPEGSDDAEADREVAP